MTAARAFARTKPIVAYKAGRFAESARVASSHTGAMAAEDAIYDAAFQRIGLARVFDIGEIFDCAELIGRHRIPKGPRLGIVTNAGGPGVMATDALIAANGVLAELSDATLAQLNENLPPYWSHGNPVDVLGDARAKRIGRAVQLVLQDDGVDAVLVILTPQAMTNATATAKEIAQLAETSAKPILAAWLGGAQMREGIRILNDVGIATFLTPEQAVGAFMTLVHYSHNLVSLYETPRDIQIAFSPERKELRARFLAEFSDSGSLLSEIQAKKILAVYGIPVTQPLLARTADQAAHFARQIGYPVVLKVLSPDISHKSDVGGIALNLRDHRMVYRAFERILGQVQDRQPGSRIEGITVQSMIDTSEGVEMILGLKKDPIFGTVILVGMGGVAAELYRDFAIGFPPLNERLVRQKLESLQVWPLLQGYRGRPPVHVDHLVEIIIRLSYLAADYPEIQELDMNPLLVTPSRAIALDARIALDLNAIGKHTRPYAHLALRPYPEEYVRQIHLKDDSLITLRPIKPEDEPMWMDLLASCSRESIYQRFRYFFQWQSHEAASRYCFNDYDREIAIVAELDEGSSRRLLGVGRLVADPDHESVEYAVLISDAWQNKGLGSVLTDYCFEIAKKWGLKKLVAQTTTDNPRMIAVFRKRGFEIVPHADGSLVEVAKGLE